MPGFIFILFYVVIYLLSVPVYAQTVFTESFTGAPPVPQHWRPTNWDVAIHQRPAHREPFLPAMDHQHGPDCSPPPAIHQGNKFENAVFLCRDHMMTSLSADGYGVLYITPNHMVDFSKGEAVIKFDMSTHRNSGRDWVDIWVTPYEDNMQLPIRDAPDLEGGPRRAVQVDMSRFVTNTSFDLYIHNNFLPVKQNRGGTAKNYESFLVQSMTRRDTFELRISRTHIRFGMPAYNQWWIDTTIADLGWDKGIVQFGHHTYTPEKSCAGCRENTWHWDNVSISPSIPFTIIRGDKRIVGNDRNLIAAGETDGPSSVVTFSEPAPANSHLRFSGITDKSAPLQVSYDGGKTYQQAAMQAQSGNASDHFDNYWTPVPQGTKTVMFRGGSWYGGGWAVKDFAIFSSTVTNRSSPTPLVSPQPTGTSTGQKLNLSVLLHGIGRGGDNVNPQSTSMTQPLRGQRSLTIELYNAANQLVLTKQATITFQPAAGNFTVVVDVGIIPAGSYTAKVKVPQYLKKSIPGILTIPSTPTTITLAQFSLVTGDINDDNSLSILDYNMLLDCFSELAPARNCADIAKKQASDLTDDGLVNQFDYNLFLRELSVQSGQ